MKEKNLDIDRKSRLRDGIIRERFVSTVIILERIKPIDDN